MPDTTSSQSLSPEEVEAILALPFYRNWKGNRTPEEIVRFELGARRCEQALSCSPYYAERATRDPDWWRKVFCSRRNY